MILYNHKLYLLSTIYETDQKTLTLLFSLLFFTLLAWQAEFRTFDWGRAIGDLETMKREIEHLLFLV